MRKTTWAILIWTVFMVWVGAVVASAEGDSFGLLARTYAPYVVVWFIGFVLLSILWLRTDQKVQR